MLSPPKGVKGKLIHIQMMLWTDRGTDVHKLLHKHPLLSQISSQNVLKWNSPDSSGYDSVGDYPSQRVTKNMIIFIHFSFQLILLFTITLLHGVPHKNLFLP